MPTQEICPVSRIFDRSTPGMGPRTVPISSVGQAGLRPSQRLVARLSARNLVRSLPRIPFLDHCHMPEHQPGSPVWVAASGLTFQERNVLAFADTQGGLLRHLTYQSQTKFRGVDLKTSGLILAICFALFARTVVFAQTAPSD